MGNLYYRACTYGIRNYRITGRGEPPANSRPPSRIASPQQFKSRKFALE